MHSLPSILASVGLIAATVSAAPPAPRGPPYSGEFEIIGESDLTIPEANEGEVYAVTPGPNPNPAPVAEVRCTPRDTVLNPSFEWLSYPFLHWNITNADAVSVYPGTGYGIDGEGLTLLEDSAGGASSGVAWIPNNNGPYEPALFGISQLVEVCPDTNYRFSVAIQVAEYDAPSPNSYVSLILGSTSKQFNFDDLPLTEWDTIESNDYLTTSTDEYITLAIAFSADPSAFGAVVIDGEYEYPSTVQINFDVVSLIPEDSADAEEVEGGP